MGGRGPPQAPRAGETARDGSGGARWARRPLRRGRPSRGAPPPAWRRTRWRAWRCAWWCVWWRARRRVKRGARRRAQPARRRAEVRRSVEARSQQARQARRARRGDERPPSSRGKRSARILHTPCTHPARRIHTYVHAHVTCHMHAHAHIVRHVSHACTCTLCMLCSMHTHTWRRRKVECIASEQ